MNGITFIGAANLPTVPQPWEIATASDFNGDDEADLLLQNMITGQRVLWFMNGTTGPGLLEPGCGWDDVENYGQWRF